MNENANFNLIWEESPTVKEMSAEEFGELVGIDPSLFNEDIDFEVIPQIEEKNEVPVAGTSGACHFLDMTDTEVHSFIHEQSNKSTIKKTMSDVKKFENFLKSKNESEEITKMDPEKLDQYLANFILSIRKADGQEYEPSSLRNIISSIDRKLKRMRYPHQIMNSTSHEFQLTRDALSAKQKSLKKQGKGNKPNRASPLTDNEINVLYEKGIVGSKDGKSLINVLWLNNCLMFGLRGTKENYNLRWGDVQLRTGADGIQYLEYCAERQTKTRTGESMNDIRPINPKIFATPEHIERCPVNFYKIYAKKRPTDFCGPNDPFYLAPRTGSQKHIENVWFMKMAIGGKKLGSLMKSMAADAGLESQKRITNHSTRKHMVQKLRDSGIAPTDIMQISGHKNIQSVLNYSEISEQKQKECSRILCSRPQATPSISFTDCSNQTSNGNNSGTSENEENLNFQNNNTANPQMNMSDSLRCVQNSGNLSSMSLQNDTINVNTQMNSLFSGAILNIQNFNVYMKN